MRPPLEADPPASEAGIPIEEERKLANTALIFPGQATQYVGMGKGVFASSQAARDVYGIADDLSSAHLNGLGISNPLSQVSFEGPKELLDRIDIAPQAILTATIALLAAFRERIGQKIIPRFVAGHSLGEYSALVAAGALNFSSAFQIVQRRSIETKKAAEQQPGAMAAVREHLGEGLLNLLNHFRLEIAAYNSEEDVTVTGEADKIRQFLAKLEEMKVRFRRLDIAGGFHSILMTSAREGLLNFLNGILINRPYSEIILNKTAQPSSNPQEIKEELADNLVSPVRWGDSMRRMAEEGITYAIEIGPQSVLAGLVRKTAPSVVVERVTDFRSIQNVNPERILRYAGVARG